MKRLAIAFTLITGLSMPGFAAEDSPLKLEKGTVLVEDFGESVGFDELRAALHANDIHAIRVRIVDRTRYRIPQANYKGVRYSLTVNRQTGKIDWIRRYDISVTLLD